MEMQWNTTDIRGELEKMIAQVQSEIGSMQEERSKIDKKLQEAESALGALRHVYELQAKRFGETKVPLFAGTGVSYRFAGMKLTEALTLIRKEQPRVNKKQACEILKKEGFDFRGKRPLPAVHFAWVAIERRKK